MRRIALLLATVLAGGLLSVTPTAAATRTSLTITADLNDGAKPYKWSLTCDPVGGNQPNRKRACSLLAKKGVALFAPTPATAACTQIYGGPEQVKITGLVKGKKINALFTRTNGCEIARFARAEALFTIPETTILRGTVTLDDQPADGTVIFLMGGKQVITSTSGSSFAVRLSSGTWTGSASVGRLCTAVTVVVPTVEQPPIVVSCRTTAG